MAKIILTPKNNVDLILLFSKLYADIPHCKMTIFKNGIGIMKRNITFHFVSIKYDLNKNTLTVQSPTDRAWLLVIIGLIVFWPFFPGLYILIRSKSINAYRKKVVDKITEYNL